MPSPGRKAGVVRASRTATRPRRIVTWFACSCLVLLLPGLLWSSFATSPARGSALGHLDALARPGTVLLRPSPGAAAINGSASVVAAPSTVCAADWPGCPANASVARVSVSVDLAAAAASRPGTTPPVQVLFLLETSPYDGAYDSSAADPGRDPCGATVNARICEESYLDSLFIAFSGSFASAIAAAHPGTELSFGLVDYFATLTDHDDGDGYSFHVDVGNFTSASGFPAAVNRSLLLVLSPLGVLGDSDLSDNFLNSPSITALYGSLSGAGVNWSSGADHVLVVLTSTAPRAPGYTEDYCASPSDYVISPCDGATCEPSYVFGTGSSPSCEGWVASQDGNTSHSIAALARSAPACAASPMGRCPIDVIDVWATPTDPNSKGWPSTANRTAVTSNTGNVLQAGCDLAAATGGSWDGPIYFGCNGTGTSGSLNGTVLPAGQADQLLAAVANASLGSLPVGLVASAGSPLLQLILAPGIALAANASYASACATPSGPLPDCPTTPVASNVSGAVMLGWNWSAGSVGPTLFQPGDNWTVWFDVTPTPGSAGNVPLLRCDAPACDAEGDGPIGGRASEVNGTVFSSGAPWTLAIPLATITVMALPALGLGLGSNSSEGEAPFSVAFTAVVTGGYQPGPVTLSYGDGASASGAGPFDHTYTWAGAFPAYASVSDAAGQRASAGQTISVLSPVLVSVQASAYQGVAPFEVNLTAAGWAGLAPYAFAWDLGNGQQTTGPSASVTYGVGSWTIQVRVTDALGYSSNASIEVTATAASPGSGSNNPGTPGSHGTPGGGSGTPGSNGGTPWNLWLVAAGAVAVGAVALAVVVGRRYRAKR